MSGRFLVLLLLLAALLTAATYVYTRETQEVPSEPGLADLVRVAEVHGWPWGYYAQVTELAQVSERAVSVLEYTDLRWRMLGQTYVAWFFLLLILMSVVIAISDPRRRRG
jgi:hypothetical protein